jgi:hypothetical protein
MVMLTDLVLCRMGVWQNYFKLKIYNLGFISSLADPDVWLHPVNKSDGY